MMNKRALKHPILIASYSALAFVGLLICKPSDARAQTYRELGPGSSYACVTFPSGRTAVGKAAKKGYAIKDFAAVSNEFKKEIKDNTDRIAQLKKFQAQLKKDGVLKKADLKVFKSRFKDLEPGEEFPNANADKILAVDALISLIQTRSALAQGQSKALKDCQRKKLQPLNTFVSRTLFLKEGDGGTWFEYVLVDRGLFDPDSVAQCIFRSGAASGVRVYADLDPCAHIPVATNSASHAPFSCAFLVPKGTLAILVHYALPTVIVGTGYDFSEASITQARGRLLATIGSPYRVRETNNSSDICQEF